MVMGEPVPDDPTPITHSASVIGLLFRSMWRF